MKTTQDKAYFYLVSNENYILCDIDACENSDRCIDIKVFDIANNQKLCNKLQLHFIEGGIGRTHTYETRGEWFADYLNSFSTGSKDREAMRVKLKSNPVIRILVTNEKLLEELKMSGEWLLN
jgi:hypothetical protein